MIIIRISGGLGNQMFQYALGRFLAKKNNTELLLDLSGLEPKNGETPRKFSLDIFNIQYKIATKKDFKALGIINPSKQGILAKGYRKFGRALTSSKPLNKRKIILERGFTFDPEILNLTDNHYLSGTWQSEKYFKSIEKELRQDFTFKEDMVDKNLAEQIRSNVSVCVSVRRTDYVTDKKASGKTGFVGKKYYEDSAAFLLKKIPDAKFFVFSDDIKWCRENLDFIPNASFVSGPESASSESGDFQLMSLCSHYIIANSTFSWWAAWLNSKKEKIVVAPKRWFAPGTFDDKDLMLREWTRI